MEKQEFINTLRMALNGRLSAAQVAENVNYYEDYINMQLRMGKPEETVMRELGDPRLIARTIIDASGQSETGGAEYQRRGYQENASRQDGYRENRYQERSFQSSTYGRGGYYNGEPEMPRMQEDGKISIGKVQMPVWVFRLLLVILAILVIIVVFSILKFLAPFFIVIGVVLFCVKLFRDWLN